ncbi:hypothetical protein [Sphaerimonospora thailandensis]|uniref:hypothetical protein n=1 Tax=Sphaerimonospora thailandensis TaxID=795644 RepID=UPI001950CF88|nr:hypothetical protein [Sphaerimonospora thailandensis]
MSLTMRKGRGVEVLVPQTWLGRMKTQARRAGVRMPPMAGSARDVAVNRIEDARLWAAPKLDQAAQSVEEQIAPIVSAFLAEMARRIDVSAARKTRRRWPVAALCTGAAIGAIGVMMYRNNAQRWTDTMRESVRDTASDAGKWVGDKAQETRDKAGRATDDIKGKMS